MPTIYTNQQITTAGANGLPLESLNTSSATRGIIITNFSMYQITITIPGKAASSMIPPYAQAKIAIPGNQLFTIESSKLSAAAAIANLDQSVSYTESDTILEPGIIPLAQLPAYNISVQGSMSLSGTDNTVNIGNVPEVAISGTPSVNVSGTASVNVANTPAVTLTGAQNNVNIANTPAVTISGTPSVQLTGSGNSVNIANTPNVAITGTPAVNVANTSIPVTNDASGTLNIAGQVNIGNTPAVTISNTPNVAIASGTVNANIQNASLNSNITNALISTGSTCVVSQTSGISIASGATANFVIKGLGESFYDEISIRAYSASGQLGYYTLKLDQLRMDVSGGSSYHTPTFPNTFNSTGYNFDSLAFGQVYNPIPFDHAYYMNAVNITITNNYTATLTDTITITVAAKYASSQVTNSSANPVPTSGNYYGTGQDGVFNSTGNVTINNTPNAPCILNYKSFTLNSGHTLSFANQAKYVLIYVQGDCVINGTIQTANAVTNVAAASQNIMINGQSVPRAGNGGQGGNGVGSNGAGGGAAGSTGTQYAPGCGGGGGGGGNGGIAYQPGQTGATGTGNAAGGGSAYGTPGTGAATSGCSTLIFCAGGSITINGTINSAGVTGGHGGNGGVVGSTYGGGGGGSCGGNQGGNATSGSASSGYSGGGGAGGSGGGVIFFFAGGTVTNNGTMNVNGGGGGAAGASGTLSGTPTAGQAGQAGSVTVYQMGGNFVG